MSARHSDRRHETDAVAHAALDGGGMDGGMDNSMDGETTVGDHIRRRTPPRHDGAMRLRMSWHRRSHAMRDRNDRRRLTALLHGDAAREHGRGAGRGRRGMTDHPPAPPVALTPLTACDPDTAPEVLWHIAREVPRLRRWIVANPRADATLLEYIAQTGGPGVKEALTILLDS